MTNAVAKKDPNLVTQHLFCDLTDKELLEKGAELADLLGDIKRVEAEKKSAASRYKAQLELLGEKAEVLEDAIISKKERRDVECRWEHDWKRGEKKLIRLDTEEVVASHPIPDDERQMRIDSVEDRQSPEECLLEDCPNKPKAKGLCDRHHKEHRKLLKAGEKGLIDEEAQGAA